MPPAALAPRRRVVRSSELSKHSAAVFAQAEAGPIDVTRRDGETLVLLTKHDDEQRELVLRLAAQLIAVSLDETGSLVDRLSVPFPWIKLLSERDEERCAKQIVATARGAFDVNQPGRILTDPRRRPHAQAVNVGLTSRRLVLQQVAILLDFSTAIIPDQRCFLSRFECRWVGAGSKHGTAPAAPRA